MKIINLTLRESTVEEAYVGVRDMEYVIPEGDYDSIALRMCLEAYKNCAIDEHHTRHIARGIAMFASQARNHHGVTAALIDGSPFLITILSGALRLAGVTPITTTQMWQQLNPTHQPRG
jgi:hypothetical protein